MVMLWSRWISIWSFRAKDRDKQGNRPAGTYRGQIRLKPSNLHRINVTMKQ